MSNKNLLNESTIRKFMKLANMEPLAEEFVSTHLQTEDEEVELDEANDEEIEEGMYGKKDEKEEEKEEVKEATDETIDEMGGDYMGKDDDEPMDDLGGEEPMDDEPMDDLGDEEEMGGDAEVSLDEEDVQALKSALDAAQTVMDKLAGGLGGDEEEMPMDDEPMDDMGEPEMEEPMGDEEEMMEDEDLGIDLVDENELVSEVLKKVVNRLAKKG
jgi:hypothetical protein